MSQSPNSFQSVTQSQKSAAFKKLYQYLHCYGHEIRKKVLNSKAGIKEINQKHFSSKLMVFRLVNKFAVQISTFEPRSKGKEDTAVSGHLERINTVTQLSKPQLLRRLCNLLESSEYTTVFSKMKFWKT